MLRLKKVRTSDLDPQALLKALPLAWKVLNLLKQKDQTMTYQQFLAAVGLVGKNTPWEARHRNWASAVLYELSAVERVTKGKTSLQYQRVVDQRGRPGMGLGREAFLMRTVTA